MQVVINPGTEPQTKHSEQNATQVANSITQDLKSSVECWERAPEQDRDGWYRFVFTNASGGRVEVDIPGIEPATVVRGKPWESPRLYVDGSSWLYGYALGQIEEVLSGELSASGRS